jgi:hypothetical protein
MYFIRHSKRLGWQGREAGCFSGFPCFFETNIMRCCQKSLWKGIVMEHELIDRAEAIQQRVLQLRDSL